jgi:hypothetical protein
MLRITLYAMTLWTAAAGGQERVPDDPLFESSERLDVVIEAPWSTYLRSKSRDEDLQGRLLIGTADDTGQAFDIGIRARGRSRHDWCDFPPVLLNFKRSQVEDTLFENQNKLKLVVHCKASAAFEQIVLKEYLVYRMLNTLTERSFRVRLLHVTFVDSDGRLNDIERYAFLIEHKQRLAERLGKEIVEVERAKVGDLQPADLNTASVFAYMIGNTDFSPIIGPGGECCHNVVLFSNGNGALLAVPYDFDQSGVVDAPYAQPNRKFGIRTVRQRVYRGRCANNDYIDDTLQIFRDRHRQVVELVDRQEGLQDATRRRVRDYIEGFFRIIDDPRRIKREIVDECVAG